MGSELDDKEENILRLKTEFELEKEKFENLRLVLENQLAEEKSDYESKLKQEQEKHLTEVSTLQQKHKNELDEKEESIVRLKDEFQEEKEKFDHVFLLLEGGGK